MKKNKITILLFSSAIFLVVLVIVQFFWIYKSSNDQKKSAVSGVNYLMLMGYLCGGWMMSRSASKAAQEIANANKSNDFLEAKLVSSDIFMTHLLPKIKSLAESIVKGDESILAMKPEWLNQ